VNLKKVVNDERAGRSYMIFEYASQGELFDYIVAHGRLSEKDARKFIRQIVSALEYCHSLLIIHRDLKPENLLLDDGFNIKISDFGLSNIMEPGKRFTTFCGSLHYACPEILRGEEYVGPGVDIWSIGVILYCLVVGRQPWDAENAEGLMHAILEDGLEVPSGLSEDCVDLLLQMLRVTESDRIPIVKIRTHPWIMEGYGEPPPSYLPPSDPIKEIDESILEDLFALNFISSNNPETFVTVREELLANKRTQLVVVYNLLLQQKHQKNKHLIEKSEGKKQQSPKVIKNLDLNEKPENPVAPKKVIEQPLTDSLSSSSRKKRKKSVIITSSRGTALLEKPKKKAVSKRGKVPSPSASPKVEKSTRRQRAVSMSPNNIIRPVIDLELLKQNKTPHKPHKKRNQTPQKARRPILTESVFKPPPIESPTGTNSVVTSDGFPPLLSEDISSKPLEQIVDEVIRVLQSQGLNIRKRKNKYLWKCTAPVNNETVTLQLEIIQVNTKEFGIIIRRIQGSFQNYQQLYNQIKKNLKL
jgi:serine/threonine protein kinase